MRTTNSARHEFDNWLSLVRSQVGSLSFGVVQIVVHDSRVVQIERTEKVRLVRKPLETDLPTRLLEAEPKQQTTANQPDEMEESL